MELPIPWFACMSFSARLIALRRDKGLTQQALADATNIHVQQIKRYEAGTSEPSAEALRKIARTFAVSTDWLLFEDGERGPDDEFRLRFEALSAFSPEERLVVREILDSLILKHQAKQLFVPAANAQ
jgi:transcriptional regulator with XRE-family HTH domain